MDGNRSIWRSSKHGYGLAAICFHWVIALTFIALVALGAWMVGLTYYDRWYHDSLALHKAIGVVVFCLLLAKFVWKLFDGKSDFGPEVKPLERMGATAMHWALNALIILIPVTGYLISTSEGAAVDLFGLFELPALFDVSERVRDLAVEIHYYLAYGAIALIAIHATAALKHHFLDRGSTLRRMLPWLRSRDQVRR